ncbi:hypothetical protein EDD90_7399 [Streptomyces sp. Ag109_O5-1]|uniref:hypothetical protein n=1 Tax=Streptomyces sp. Ag109_O5-1 TaxID=1938851 RepID=UPI000FC1C984|nr:hypothetical protein [Streptomyces sp. Ag109_O5-1]RPE44169.1 hypothetical protein EDD90_7399 [Streptomyces sp. Ag109_O5-1]
MTISYVGIGSVAQHTDTITVAYPAGASAGQLAILQVASGHPSLPQPVTPSGWTLAGSFTGGGGTWGSGTGPRRVTMFVRVLAGADAQPTTSIPSGTSGSVIAGAITLLSRSAGTDWRWVWEAGEDTTSGTAFSAPCSTSATWAPGDFVWLGYSLPSSTTGIPTQGITAAGITFGTTTGRLSSAVATGNGVRIGSASTSVSSGTATVVPTITATLGASTTGVAGAIRIREASSDVNATAQSVFPPRNLVSATGLTGDDIVTVTLYRQVGTTLTAVRAASGIDVTGQSALLRVDAEQPFGISLNYAALLTDMYGTQWTVYSGPITSTVNSDVISDAVRGVGAQVFIEDWPDKKRTRDATTFNINGRLVVQGKKRSSAQATVTVSTDTDDDGEDLQDVLDNATEGTILIRKEVTLPGVDGWLALLDDDERRNWQTPYRLWDLDTVETQPWPDVLEAAGFTLQDIANNFSTLQDIANAFPGTLLDIAQFDFGP